MRHFESFYISPSSPFCIAIIAFLQHPFYFTVKIRDDMLSSVECDILSFCFGICVLLRYLPFIF